MNEAFLRTRPSDDRSRWKLKSVGDRRDGFTELIGDPGLEPCQPLVDLRALERFAIIIAGELRGGVRPMIAVQMVDRNPWVRPGEAPLDP